MDNGEPETRKEAMMRPNGNLRKISAIPEVNNYLSRMVWIPMKRSVVKANGRNPVPIKWVFKSKEKADGLICLKLRNVVKGYIQVSEVDFIYSFSPVTSDTSTSILI